MRLPPHLGPRQAGRAALAFDRDLRAVVGQHLAAGGFQAPPGFGIARGREAVARGEGGSFQKSQGAFGAKI